MKKRWLPLLDKLILRKRAIIETVNDLLKNSGNIDHTRHRSPVNLLVNIISGLIAYTYRDKLPAINFSKQERELISLYCRPLKQGEFLLTY
jgi:hypothetical protein